MKPPPFRYVRPTSVTEAVDLMARDGAMVLAGGQDLVPDLSARAVRPEMLVDLGGIDSLTAITVGDASVTVGAMATHSAIGGDLDVARALPIMSRAAGLIGHQSIRNRGTIGGSICSALPGAEWLTLSGLLNPVLHLRSIRGDRHVAARELLLAGEHGRARDEVLLEATFEVIGPRARWYFDEVSRPGLFKFPVVSVGVLLPANDPDRIVICIGGGVLGPMWFNESLERLLDPASWQRICAEVEFGDDPLHGKEVKTRFAMTLVRAGVETVVEGKGTGNA